MLRDTKAHFFSFFVLVVFEIYLFLNPVYAATCTAECGAGKTVSCSGHGCAANDGGGCMSWDQDRNLVEEKECSDPKPE